MRLSFLLGFVLVCFLCRPAWAEHAEIDLRVFRYDASTGKILGSESASADEDPPLGGVKKRPLLKVRANDPLVVQFFFINTYPHHDIPDVTIQYFVVPEEKVGQKTLPDLTKDVVTQGRFKLNFKLKTKVGARVAFKAPKPGIYLVRVQSLNTQSDHEHFSAIDLQVE